MGPCPQKTLLAFPSFLSNHHLEAFGFLVLCCVSWSWLSGELRHAPRDNLVPNPEPVEPVAEARPAEEGVS